MIKHANDPVLTHGEPRQPSPSKKRGSSSKPKEASAPNVKANSRQQSKHEQPKKGHSKQDRVVALLRRTEGTSVAAVMKATGWQKHSVHGFFAGVVRKKLGLNLVLEQAGDERIYRIIDGKRTKAGTSSRKRAA